MDEDTSEHVIKLENTKCMELVIERFYCKPFSEVGGGEDLFGRFHYECRENTILVHDLFIGDEMKILPKDPTQIKQFEAYAALSVNSAIVVYKTRSKPAFISSYHCSRGNVNTYLCVSIISINFNDSSYEFICNPRKLFFVYSIPEYGITCLSDNKVLIKCSYFLYSERYYRLQFFKLDDMFSSIEFERSMIIPDNSRCFGLVNNKVMFINVYAYHQPETVEGVVQINEDYSLMDIKNSSKRFPFPKCPFDDLRHRSTKDRQGRWHGTKLFYYHSVEYELHSGSSRMRFPELPSLWVFDMENQQWSNIIFNFSLDKGGYKFDVDRDGVITFLRGVNWGVTKRRVTHWDLLRSPTHKPDKLFNLAWIQVKNCDLSDNFTSMMKLAEERKILKAKRKSRK